MTSLTYINDFGLYISGSKNLSYYYEMYNFINENREYINCPNYHSTLEDILKEETYENQIKVFIEQFRAGYNSIDYLFNKEVEAKIDDSEINDIIEVIMRDIEVEEFHEHLIGECSDYYYVNVDENKLGNDFKT